MPKRPDIKKIMIIGSGPTVIGHGAEFDCAGTQACLTLRQAGYEVILANPNPAAVMTDVSAADKVYAEPLTLEYVARILRRERPDAIIPTLGGRTALNLALQLHRKGILRECRAELLGIGPQAAELAEDPWLFSGLCKSLGLAPITPAESDLPGWKEIGFTLLRDQEDNVVTLSPAENIDPFGIHPGDAMAVIPCQTVPEHILAGLGDAAARLVRALSVSGVCGVRFALSPDASDYRVVTAVPRFTRAAGLAAKATGYPVARVAAQLSAGMILDEIMLDGRSANFDPKPNYIVTKMPRFPFDRFPGALVRLDGRMKSAGAAMAIGRTLTESLMKAVRALDAGACHLYLPKFDGMDKARLLNYVRDGADDRIHAIAQLFRLGADPDEIHAASRIDPVYLSAIAGVVQLETQVAEQPFCAEVLEKAKKSGFSDKYIAKLWAAQESSVYEFRLKNRIAPEYLMADTCARDDWSYIPYFYSSYNGAGRHGISGRKKIIILGSGPARIGQGAEFDYAVVRSVREIERLGYETIVINDNPDAVSTDHTVGDKLYFEPLTAECVSDIAERERPVGVVASLGGQTAAGLAKILAARGIPLIGTGVNAITLCEDRDSFEKLLLTQGIPQPGRSAVADAEAAAAAAAEMGYPVLVRADAPGGTIRLIGSEEALRACFSGCEITGAAPLLIEKYIEGRELEVNAVCDGVDVFIPGMMEHVERTGIHSGDSIGIYPAVSVTDAAKGRILAYTKKLGAAVGVIGLYNVQFIVDKNDTVYVTGVAPRAGRTVPFLARATGWPMADIAAGAMLGRSLREQGIFTLYPEERKKYYVKAPAFSFSSLPGADACLSTEMKSTGEALGCDRRLTRALYKALQASGLHVQNYGTVFATVADADKTEALSLIRRFYDLGFNIEATCGTAAFLKANGIRTHVSAKLSDGSGEILDSISRGHVTYVINTRTPDSPAGETDGMRIRRCAAENGTAVFTSLDTVRVLLDVLEEMTICAEALDS